MNPFLQRGRITDPARFVGRWRELSALFDRLDTGRPVMLTGMAGIGKSSLITHVAQSAAVNLERPDLRAFYIDMGVLPDEQACYALLVQALGSRGDTPAALELALLEADDPVVVCLDRADRAITAGWGSTLLEKLARLARQQMILQPGASPLSTMQAANGAPAASIAGSDFAMRLVVAAGHSAPVLSEPFATIGLGALSNAEVRLFADAYLDSTSVQFSPRELRELTNLSLGHPAYVQRAAYHLYKAYTEAGYDWQAAYLEEARDRPVPGAPLPPGVFEGEEVAGIQAFYGGQGGSAPGERLQHLDLADSGDMVGVLLALVLALLAWQLSASWLVGAGVLLVGVGLVLLYERVRQRRAHNTDPPDTP